MLEGCSCEKKTGSSDCACRSHYAGRESSGSLLWAKSYGSSDMDKKAPATTDAVYRIGSITKQFTALMLLQLVHDGKVRFSDPVEKYFPEIHLIKGEYKNAPP